MTIFWFDDIVVRRTSSYYSSTLTTFRENVKSPLSAWQRDVCVTVHQMPIRGFLKKFRRMRSDRCPLCAMDVEYVFHLVHSSIRVKRLWCIINNWLSAITRLTVKFSIEQALFFNFLHRSTENIRIATVLSSELLNAIWIIRNEVVFDHKRKSTIDTERLFRHLVRWCIKTDFVRLNRQTFIDLWCNVNVLAKRWMHV